MSWYWKHREEPLIFMALILKDWSLSPIYNDMFYIWIKHKKGRRAFFCPFPLAPYVLLYISLSLPAHYWLPHWAYFLDLYFYTVFNWHNYFRQLCRLDRSIIQKCLHKHCHCDPPFHFPYLFMFYDMKKSHSTSRFKYFDYFKSLWLDHAITLPLYGYWFALRLMRARIGQRDKKTALSERNIFECASALICSH